MTNGPISKTELRFEPSSGEDTAGKTFHWDSRFFRGISGSHDKLYTGILNSPIAEELFRLGLVHTAIAKERFENFRTVLEHDKIPIVSYPTEWCPLMLKEAALLTCDIETCLVKNGYALKDAHPWNVLFQRGMPVFVDFGSIVPKTKPVINFFLLQFRSDFIRPLILKRCYFKRLVNTLMATDMGIWHDLDINRMLFNRLPFREWLYFVWYDYRITQIWRKSPQIGLALLKKQIAGINPSPYKKPKSNNYPLPKKQVKAGNFAEETVIVTDLLERQQPKSMIVFGSPDEALLSAVTSKINCGIIFDTDDERLNDIHKRLKHISKKMLPLRVDICSPPKPYGIGNMCSAPQDRLRMDFGIMLWSSPYSRLCFRKHSLEKIARGLALFVKNGLLVEFEEIADASNGSRPLKHGERHGSLSSFMAALKPHFHDISIHSQTGPSRWMLLCNR